MCKPASVGSTLVVGGVLVLVFGVFLAAAASVAWRKPERSNAWWTAGLAAGLSILSVVFLRPTTFGATPPGAMTWAYLFISYGLTWALALPALLWLITGFRPSPRLRFAALVVSVVPLLGMAAWLLVQVTGDACAGLA